MPQRNPKGLTSCRGYSFASQIKQNEIIITTSDGEMPAFLCIPAGNSPKPAIVVLMEAFGLTEHIKEVTVRIANEGYLAIAPDLYYRDLPNNKFDYYEVESAKLMMNNLDFDKTVSRSKNFLETLCHEVFSR